MPATGGFLDGVRVLELADELGEYCGMRLAGFGADVIKIEPPGGEATRSYGPFYGDEPDREKSLYFWHYNLGKRGIVLDLDTAEGQEQLRSLAATSDVLIDARPRGYLDSRGVGYEALSEINPGLVYLRISAFGDDGPWADYKASDLVHLALGGMMIHCGYDPHPSGFYETPPIAPQMWQAYHMGGEMAALGAVAALNYRARTGLGQHLSTAVHDSVSKTNEVEMPTWVYRHQLHQRQTCRHSSPQVRDSVIKLTKDGRWVLPYQTYTADKFDSMSATVGLLKKYGMEMDLEDEQYKDPAFVSKPATGMHIQAAVSRLISSLMFSADIWKEAQAGGMPWAPLRRPEENLVEEHWTHRETFVEYDNEQVGRSFTDVGATWRCGEVPRPEAHRAPMLGEHTDQVIEEFTSSGNTPRGEVTAKTDVEPVISKRGKPFALSGVRIIDLSWMLASGGAGRYFTSLGAEVIKVEHSSRPDSFRSGIQAPAGGREERDRATGPITSGGKPNRNRGGIFLEISAGKRSCSLNLKEPRAIELLSELIAGADMVIEGFSPGTMERMGLGYERLKELNPSIIYVQQSGMGQVGTLGRIRTFGPSAQALSGLSEMSGLPEPFPPAGIGFSYLDWYGAYNMANAMMAALYRLKTTGQGCHIDSSQTELGLYLTGTAVLNYSANGERWARYGNRSPHKPAAPSGAYRVKGDDRWIAITCFDEPEWQGLVSVLGHPAWAAEERFSTLAERLVHQDDLDRLVGEATEGFEPYELMEALQAAGVPAGVCQNSEDCCDFDPQLKFLEWKVELPQTEIGTWPVREFPVMFSKTPAYMGGTLGRSGPNYGEDNDYVLGEILGLSAEEIEELAGKGVT